MAALTTVNTVHFNSLPPDVRQRFVAITRKRSGPAPIFIDTPGVGRTVLYICLGVFALFGLQWLWNDDYGQLWGKNAIYSSGGLMAMGICVFTALAMVAVFVRRALIARRLPFVPAVYVIGPNLIDARTAKLRITPVMRLTPEVVHHYTNGSYTNTTIALRGNGGHVFSIRNRHRADTALGEMRDMLTRFFKAVEERDFATIAELDIFLTAGDPDSWSDGGKLGVAPPREGPAAKKVPAAVHYAVAVAALVAAGVSPALWYARNNSSDDKMFESAKRSTSSLRDYLNQGGRHADEAWKLMFVRGLEEARERKSVTALREYLTQYEKAPDNLKAEARAAIHEHFVESLATFKKTAPPEATQTIQFVEQLMTFQEAHDSPPLLVSFLPPLVDSLQKIDDMLAETARKEKSKLDVAPIAPHFTESTAERRETTIVAGLTEGFTAVFPNDIVHLEHGARRAADSAAPKDQASIDVSYQVAPMYEDDGEPVIYQEVNDTTNDPLGLAGLEGLNRPTGRLYVGVVVRFSILMRIPDQKDAHEIILSVKPPEHFTVPANGYGDASIDDASIYYVMAERAFDELRTNLTTAFFGIAPPAAEAEDRFDDRFPPGDVIPSDE
jgi:hypothetical protein